MDWLQNLFKGGSLTSLFPAGNVPVSMGGSGMHPGMETGYQPVYGQQNPLPSNGLSNISTITGAPTSWWDDFRSGLDRDFLAAAAGSLGQGASGYRGRGIGGGVGRAAVRYGANIRPAEPVPAGMPVPGTAPNPSFAQGLVLPRRRQDQYSGGY